MAFCLMSCRAVDHQWGGSLFATAGARLDVWDHNRFHSILVFPSTS